MALMCAFVARAQTTTPGTLADFRARLSRARACYERVDYRCVIEALEVPLLVRDLPEGVTSDERREAYELLGVVYYSNGLLDSGDAAFSSLLEGEPDYHLSRTDVPPEWSERVERLWERRQLQLAGQDAARLVEQHARWRAFWRSMLMAVASGPTRSVGQRRAREVVERAAWLAPLIASPPFGPWSGPTLQVGSMFRLLFGDDRSVWGDAIGIEAFVGARYRPFYVHLGVRWTQHSTVLSDVVIEPAPDLTVWVFSVGGGVRFDFDSVSLRTGLELGMTFLDTEGFARALNPHVAIPVWFGAELIDDFEIQIGVSGEWTLGLVNDEVAASTSLVFSLGLSYAF